MEVAQFVPAEANQFRQKVKSFLKSRNVDLDIE